MSTQRGKPVTKKRALKARLDLAQWELSHDPLTDLLNRRGLNAKVDEWARDSVHHLTVVILDLDGFKAINDTYGHAKGDGVLVSVATQLLEVSVAYGGVAARFGGDEFVVIAPGSIHGLCAAIETATSGLPLSMGVDYGLADAFNKVLQHADLALYHSKRVKGTFATAWSSSLSMPVAAEGYGRRQYRDGSATVEWNRKNVVTHH